MNTSIFRSAPVLLLALLGLGASFAVACTQEDDSSGSATNNVRGSGYGEEGNDGYGSGGYGSSGYGYGYGYGD